MGQAGDKRGASLKQSNHQRGNLNVQGDTTPRQSWDVKCNYARTWHMLHAYVPCTQKYVVPAAGKDARDDTVVPFERV